MARLRTVQVSTASETGTRGDNDVPVLEPDLDRPFGHVDFLGDPLAHGGSRCRVLIELLFEGGELILGGPLTLLVLLLLRQSALPGRAPRVVARRVPGRSGLGRRGLAGLGASRCSRRETGSERLGGRVRGRRGFRGRMVHIQLRFHGQSNVERVVYAQVLYPESERLGKASRGQDTAQVFLDDVEGSE